MRTAPLEIMHFDGSTGTSQGAPINRTPVKLCIKQKLNLGQINYLNHLLLLKMQAKSEDKYQFIYNGVEYDATSYVSKHPGGRDFIDNMRAERKDFTEYFKCLHSEEAEKILKSFQVVSRHDPSNDSKQYLDIYEKVKHLYKVRWEVEITLMAFVASTFITGCFTSIGLLSIVCFGFSQIVCGWMGHSMSHSRDKKLGFAGRIYASLVGGFCLEWWAPKHNMHHIFTNSKLYDDDIKHDYKVYLYPFLYLKWRFDSLEAAIAKKNYLDLFNITLNYCLLFYCRKNLIYFVIGELLAGFFSAFVLIGNHERQKRYNQQIEQSFLDHQIITCRNYRENSLFWLIMMGGMQFQTEHHMFPQIPFYSLYKAEPIIRAELAKLNKSIIYGPVL